MLSYNFDFTYPVECKGVHVGDVDLSCAATVWFEPNGSWLIDEWRVLGLDGGEISIGRVFHERDDVAESLRRAIQADWDRRKPMHCLNVERIIREAIADGGSDYHYERSREAA